MRKKVQNGKRKTEKSVQTLMLQYVYKFYNKIHYNILILYTLQIILYNIFRFADSIIYRDKFYTHVPFLSI